MIFHTSLQRPRQNINQSRKRHPIARPIGERWGVFFDNFDEIWPCYNGTALYKNEIDWLYAKKDFFNRMNSALRWNTASHIIAVSFFLEPHDRDVI